MGFGVQFAEIACVRAFSAQSAFQPFLFSSFSLLGIVGWGKDSMGVFLCSAPRLWAIDMFDRFYGLVLGCLFVGAERRFCRVL